MLEVETDKAQMDVEAQDDGVMAKILVNSYEHHNMLRHTDAEVAKGRDEVDSSRQSNWCLSGAG